MYIKAFEIRDRSTLIPAVAIKVQPRDEAERWLMERAGFGPQPDGSLIWLFRMIGGNVAYDPFGWPRGSRTMPMAHLYIAENWDKLKSGDVVCVETILRERTEPKISERLEAP